MRNQTPYLPDSEPRFNVPLKKQISISPLVLSACFGRGGAIVFYQ